MGKVGKFFKKAQKPLNYNETTPFLALFTPEFHYNEPIFIPKKWAKSGQSGQKKWANRPYNSKKVPKIYPFFPKPKIKVGKWPNFKIKVGRDFNPPKA